MPNWKRAIEARLRGARIDAARRIEIVEELSQHLQDRYDELRAGGAADAPARDAALAELEDNALLRGLVEIAPARTDGVELGQRSGSWLADLGGDLRYAIRMLRKNPGFAAVVILTLALGIGANTAIFSVVDAVLLRPLPYKADDQLVVILRHGTGPISPANFVDYRAQATSFAAMGAAEYWTPNLTDVDQPEHLRALRLTVDTLPLLGVAPAIGRVFAAGEDQPGRERVVVLSDGLWRRQFGADAHVIGTAIRLDGQPYSVIGVMPPSFKFAPFWATKAELWVPLAFGARATDRGAQSLRVFARLAPGVDVGRARAELAAITAGLERQFPGTNRDVQVVPLRERVVGQVQPALLVLLGAVGFVLLMACANVAHMLLARATARQREIAVRAALGATRARMMRQFLTESLLLALLGAGAGLAFAAWGVRALVAFGPSDIPRVDTVGLDLPVLVFVLAIAVLAGIGFGLAPVAQVSLDRAAEALNEGGRGSSDSRRRSRLRDLLVASEFALAIVLLVGAGLMLRSFAEMRAIDAGFDPHRVLTTIVSVAGTRQAAAGVDGPFYRDLLDQVRVLPGVTAAGAINHLPLAGDIWMLPFEVQGRPKSRPGEAPNAVYRVVMPGYFQAMGIPLLRGRDIAAADTAAAEGVVVVSEALAARTWPGEDAVGKRVTFHDEGGAPRWLSVIGIAKDARQSQWTSVPDPEAYLAVAQTHDFLTNRVHVSYLTLVVRVAGDAAALAPSVRRAVSSLEPRAVLSDMQTMDDAIADATARPRFYALLLGLFASVALTLAAVGIYGVMSYAVSRRTHEIGVRMSLGAQRGDVVRLIVGQGMRVACAGTVAGLGGALATSRAMSTLLYGVGPADPLTFAAALIVLSGAALAASYIPAQRATRINPIDTLRGD